MILRNGNKKISAKLISLISTRFLNVEKTLFKFVMYLVDFETGGLGESSMKVKELFEDGSVEERELKTKEDFLEVVFLPLREFEERFVDIEDENGVVHSNKELIEYRNKLQGKYERMATRIVILALLGFSVGVFQNWISNFIPN